MRKPIDEIVDRLAAEIRSDPSGAKSLAHLLVIVPTAQSGRRLRLKLAERMGAVIPPSIKLPQQLLGERDQGSGIGDQGVVVAGRTDELVAFQEALGKLGMEPGMQNIVTPAKDLIRLTESAEKRNSKLLQP